MKKLKSIIEKLKNLNPKGLAEGMKNLSSGDIEEVAEYRASICNECEFKEDEPIETLRIRDNHIPSISGKICGKCFCALPYLTRQNEKGCTLKKWDI